MKYREILEAAVRAPSGDNCQPWRFEIKNNEIRIFNVPERDTSLYNYRQRASLIAHGALLENLYIVALTHGLSAEFTLFPDASSPDLVAIAILSPCEPHDPSLNSAIHKRCTNRRRYRGGVLTDGERRAIVQLTQADGFAQLHLLEGTQMREAAHIIGVNDRIVFENRALHHFLFDQIRWSDEEALRTGDGLDIRTLELAFPDSLVFPLFRNWGVVSFLRRFGLIRIIEENARKLALSAAGIGIVTVAGNSPSDYLHAGRVMERAWLEATNQGLAFQVMTGITFLMEQVEEGGDKAFSVDHRERLRSARRQLQQLCGGGAAIPAVIFRVGRAAPPTAMSRRRPLME